MRRENMNAFQEITQMKKDYEAKVAAVGKEAVVAAYVEAMAPHPTVLGVRWQQYTPYFNDGDACTFSSGDVAIRFEGAAEDAGDREDGYQERYGLTGEQKACFGVLPNIDDDILLAVFGDHVEVTIGRDGTCEVEEYSHD